MARVRRFRLMVLALLVIAIAGSPAMWIDGRGQSLPTLGAASPADESSGITGEYDLNDFEWTPAVRCDNQFAAFPGILDVFVHGPAASIAPGRTHQSIGMRIILSQVLPGGQVHEVALSDLAVREGTANGPWVSFPPATFGGIPIGPHYLVGVEFIWYGVDDATEEGSIRATFDHHLVRALVDDQVIGQTVESRCDSPELPIAQISADRGIVNSRLAFDLYYLPINTPLQVEWDGRTLTSFQTDDRGEVHASFRIPAAPMGPHTIEWFTGTWTVSETFTVDPRIKVTPGAAARGQEVDVSLRGYAAREVVRIRWKNGDSWVEIARVTTSSTGSANIDVTVPAWASEGANSVRGDSIVAGGGRAQTNAFDVLPAGSIHLSPERGTVNSRVTATIANFPPNSPVTVTFHGFYEATASGTTDDQGQAVLTLRVPASPLGPHDVEATGGTTAQTSFEIAPRIKLTPDEAAPGADVGVSLRGFGARETVRIRWKRDGGFEQIATMTTSGSGSANLTVAVPDWAEDGPTSVRGDGAIGRAQTNAFVVAGGEIAAAEREPSPAPSAMATPKATPSPTVPSPTAESTITPEPTATVEPTAEPTATPTEVPTALPTVAATPTVEPTPAATPPADINEGEP